MFIEAENMIVNHRREVFSALTSYSFDGIHNMSVQLTSDKLLISKSALSDRLKEPEKIEGQT